MESEVVLQAFLFLIGLGLLYFGAEGLVRGSSNLARALRIRPVIVGLTVVAFGTSAPELVVSLLAAARRSEALAVGNIVGSNIANIGLILGLAALIRPLKFERGLIKREVPMMLAASFLFYGFAWSGAIKRTFGGILFAGLLAFLLYSALMAREHPEEVQVLERELQKIQPPVSSPGKDWLLLLLGLGGLLGGAQLLVDSAVYFARTIGVGEGIIGLSLVAGGTSLPELATSVVAALKRETEISVGNIIGSNLFNILAVVGLVSLVRPLPVEPSWLLVQFPVMLLLSLALLPIMWDHKITRWEGGLLLAAYLAFLAWLF
ncbi:MAG: calcium/sodium antiporter [Candidatus Bipolaricaulia bacterium]